jgi:hypothetical protein
LTLILISAAIFEVVLFYKIFKNENMNIASIPVITSTNITKNISQEIIYEESLPVALSYNDYYRFIKDINPNILDKDLNLIYESAEYYCNERGIPLDIFMCMGREESNFKKFADSFLGPESGRGVWQVSEAVLEDFNNKYAWRFNKFYTPNDLYDIKINAEVATWAYRRNFLYGNIPSNEYDEGVVAYNVGADYFKNNRYDLLVNKKYKGRDYKHLDKVKVSFNSLYDIK